ncbi:gliding motility lipoprotein GldK [Bacteroidia bacterium]|nr:gliding motility lipoprotein GldK [Bacteroidia bacterium]
MSSKKHILTTICLLIGIVVVCSSAKKKNGGELVGVQGRVAVQYEEPPYGMVLVPQSNFIMGMNDQDAFFAMNAPTFIASVDAFWMDETEITNNEYRQFVRYVYDSVARRVLGEQFEEFLILEDNLGNPIDPPQLNWKSTISKRNPDYVDALNAGLFNPPRPGTGKTLMTEKLIYSYGWIDYEAVVGRARGANASRNRNPEEYYVKEDVPIYPDTLVWKRDFEFSYNDPLTFQYYAHPSYDDYPVVGVSWKQATAFCNWRTEFMTAYCAANKKNVPSNYRLPTEAEWECAARGGLDQQMYPWGGPYTYDRQGCYFANFQPQRARYGLDGGVRTVPVGAYRPNDYGLYDMAGNVAEWVIDAYDEQGYKFTNPLNPQYLYNAAEGDPLSMKRKVIRGGSWKDIAYFLQCGVRTFEYQDTSKSYIGFRCVRAYMGK